MGQPLKKEESYTYADYLTWPEDQRVELIDGQIYDMSPAPSLVHQLILVELSRQIANFLKNKACKVLVAPFDVRLSKAEDTTAEIDTVVQPDIVIVCDPKKLDDRGCKGAPDFVAEIVSPFTAGKDQIKKARLYEKHGVKEYWILHPLDQLLNVRILKDTGQYEPPQLFEGKGKLSLHILPELEIDLDEVFGAQQSPRIP